VKKATDVASLPVPCTQGRQAHRRVRRRVREVPAPGTHRATTSSSSIQTLFGPME